MNVSKTGEDGNVPLAEQPLAPTARRVSWKSWMRGQLFRLYLKLRTVTFKSALQLRQFSLSLLDAEIRLLSEALLQLGEDDDDDNVVEYVARQLTHRPMLRQPEITAQRAVLATTLLERASAAQEVQRAVTSYFLALAFTEQELQRGQAAQDFLDLAKAVDSAAAPLDDAAVTRRLAEVKRRRRLVMGALAERSAVKISTTLPEISALLGIVSVIFLCSGFLYTWFFFRFFGIDVSLFFSLADYLAASLEQIRSAAYSAALALTGFLWGFRDASLRSRLEHRAQATRGSRMKWLMNCLVVVCWLACIWSIYQDEPLFFLMQLAGVFGAVWFAGWISPRVFKQAVKAQVAIAGILLFTMHVGVSAFERADGLLRGKPFPGATTTVFLKPPSGPAVKAQGRLIAANSSYLFLLADDLRTVDILPKERLDFFSVQKR